MAAFDHTEDVPLERRPPDCRVPLTARQRQVWGDPVKRSRGWRMSAVATRICGPLNRGLLQESIQAVIERHEALRTRFVSVDGIPEQRIEAARGCDLPLLDLSRGPPGRIEAQARSLAHDFFAQPVDLATGPLFEGRLLKLSDAQYVLLIALDHMVSDAVSYEILAREIWTVYQQRLHCLPSSLPEPALQFGDYAVWQERTYDTWLQRHEPYWRNRLAGARGVQVPFDFDAAPTSQPPIARIQFGLGRTASAALRDLAAREATRLPLAVLTIYIAVMARWCEQSDLLLGFVAHGRRRPELAGLMGFIAGVLHFRVEVGYSCSFLELLKQVHHEYYSASRHWDFDRTPDLVPECATQLYFNWPPNSATFQWLPVNWTFNWRPLTGVLGGDTATADDALRVRPFPLRPHRLFAFMPYFFEFSSGIIGVVLMYRTDLLATATAERFAQCFQSFTRLMVERPHVRIPPWPHVASTECSAGR